jgi:hypothetical protein
MCAELAGRDIALVLELIALLACIVEELVDKFVVLGIVCLVINPKSFTDGAS